MFTDFRGGGLLLKNTEHAHVQAHEQDNEAAFRKKLRLKTSKEKRVLPWYEKHIASIRKVAESQETKVFSIIELKQLFQLHRSSWEVPKTFNYRAIVDLFVRLEVLKNLSFKTPDKFNEKLLYTFGSPTIYAVATAFKSGSYLSHLSAAYIQQLTLNVPTRLYVSKERSSSKRESGDLTQAAIDKAFREPARTSQNVFELMDYSIVYLETQSPPQLGIVQLKYLDDTLHVTCLERTLIDMTVRPHYSGGIHQVLEAFFRAKESLSIPILISILRKLGHVYPYHQAIGFYLEKAGYDSESFNRFKKLFPMNYDFYLVHDMREPIYDPEWKLYLPSGMEIMR